MGKEWFRQQGVVSLQSVVCKVRKPQHAIKVTCGGVRGGGSPLLDCIGALLCSGCAEHVGNFRHTLPLGEFENAYDVGLRVYCYIGVDVRDRQ